MKKLYNFSLLFVALNSLFIPIHMECMENLLETNTSAHAIQKYSKQSFYNQIPVEAIAKHILNRLDLKDLRMLQMSCLCFNKHIKDFLNDFITNFESLKSTTPMATHTRTKAINILTRNHVLHYDLIQFDQKMRVAINNNHLALLQKLSTHYYFTPYRRYDIDGKTILHLAIGTRNPATSRNDVITHIIDTHPDITMSQDASNKTVIDYFEQDQMLLHSEPYKFLITSKNNYCSK